MDLRLESKLYVRDQQGEKLEAGDKLMIGTEPRMKSTYVVHHAGVEIGQTLERDRRPLEILEDRLEPASIAGRDCAFGVYAKARVRPGFDERGAPVVDLAAPVEHVEHRIAERQLKTGEVDVEVFMEIAVAIEDAARREGVRVRVKIQQATE